MFVPLPRQQWWREGEEEEEEEEEEGAGEGEGRERGEGGALLSCDRHGGPLASRCSQSWSSTPKPDQETHT